MKKVLLSFISLLMSFLAAVAIETDKPGTPLGWPFTAVVEDLKLHNSTSVDGDVIGTVPVEVELTFRDSEENEHWIYIDDEEHNVHGWCLDLGGFYGDASQREADDSKYRNELEYAYATLRANPDAYRRSSDVISDLDLTMEDEVPETVDAGYDDEISQAVEAHNRNNNKGVETAWDKFLKWVIILSLVVVLALAYLPLLPTALRQNVCYFLALAGLAEIIYSFHWSVFESYKSGQLFSAFLLGLFQVFTIVIARKIKSLKFRNGLWVSVAGLVSVAASIIIVRGIGEVVGSIVAGIINLVLGCVVLVLIYAFFKDGPGSSSSSGDEEDGESSGDRICRNCAWYDSGNNLCKRSSAHTRINETCSGYTRN